MRVIEPKELRQRPSKRKHVRKLRWLAVLIFVLVLIGGTYTAMAYRRPVHAVSPQPAAVSVAPQNVPLPWPAYGQAAMGAQGYGLLASVRSTTAVPIASVAKVVTALAVLCQKPLAVGQQGPLITITATDVGFYDDAVAAGGSVVPVVEGEQISEYQALQAMLLPSANNMADTLANWAFGSTDAFLAYANAMVKSLGMSQTHMADASGFSSGSVSTANDLVRLGEVALQDPVFAEIVNQSSADIPVAGTVSNVNFLVGQDGIVGIKTGNTTDAGGCYLFASTRQVVPGQNITLVGAILGAPSLGVAMRDSLPLIDAAYQGFGNITVAKAGQVVGHYALPWDGTIAAVAQKDLIVFGWKGSPYRPTLAISDVSVPKPVGYKVGSISVSGASGRQAVSVVLAAPAPGPSKHWRLFH